MTTFGDLKEYVRDNYADAVDAKGVRVQERIVNQAQQRLARSHDWSYYMKYGRINFSGPFTDGLVEITTGENELDFTTADVWPLDITDRHVTINGNSEVEFEVVTRNSATKITFLTDHIWLPAAVNGVTYEAYKYRYSLPSDFRKFYYSEAEDTWHLDYLTPMQFTEMKLRADNYRGDPRFYTIREKTVLEVWPWPTTDRAFDFNYVRWPITYTADGDNMDWDENLLDVLYACIDVEVVRSWGKGAPNDIASAEGKFQRFLREAKVVDTHRAYQPRRQYTMTRQDMRLTRWRRQVGPDL